MTDPQNIDTPIPHSEDSGFYLTKTSNGSDRAKPPADHKTLKTSLADINNNFGLALRGLSINKIIDCASPLIALIMRIGTLSRFHDIEDLHKRCRAEIDAIELELHKEGYDRVTALAFRYCLCSVIDETVLVTPWGEQSSWSQNSLLAIYHQETWGGEKFFEIVIKLMDDPHRYIDLIEFLYLCMVLGYEGRYRPQHNGKLNLEAFMKEVHDVIRKERGYPDVLKTFEGSDIVSKEHVIKWQTPIMVVIFTTIVIAIILYIFYFFYTEQYTNGVLKELSHVLNG